MTVERELSSAADCSALLQSVLVCLDRMAQDDHGITAQSMSLAALHVQQAIDLIDPRHALDS